MPTIFEKPEIGYKNEYSKYKDDKEIRFEAIAELERPLERILERIGSENFDLIIGDDASDRIPTLILSKFFGAKAEKENKKTPQTIFIAGGTRGLGEKNKETTMSEKKERITHFLNEKVDTTSKYCRVLIVTDTIDTGATLQPVIMALKEYVFHIHVAAVALLGEGMDLESAEKAKKELGEKFGIDITYGTIETPAIWSRNQLSGVKRKENPSEIHSRPIKKTYAHNRRTNARGEEDSKNHQSLKRKRQYYRRQINRKIREKIGSIVCLTLKNLL